jgi:hypothetical protein
MASGVIGVTRTDYGTSGCCRPRLSHLSHWPLMTLLWLKSDQPQRRHQALISEDADRRLLSVVELDTGR